MSSLVVNSSQAQSSDAANAVKEVAKAQAAAMPVSYHKRSSWRYLCTLSFFGFLHHFVLTAFSFDTQ